MTANVIQLPPDSVLRTPIGHVIRTGDTFYRKLERLHAEDRLPAGAVIVDASRVRFQRQFVQALRDQRADISLDTKAAELSAIGKFRGRAKEAPWAPVEEDRPLKPDDFKAGANIDLFGKIARLAIEVGVTSVMAPTHFLRQGGEDAWLLIDRESVLALRDALDREGGNRIGIDYPLILPHTFLPDEGHRKHLMAAICDLPIDNLVLRLSGFGADAGPLTIRRTLIAIHKLHPLGYPILLDHIGGLVGVSTIAFGIASGIAHGIGERERFDGRDWHKPQKVRETGTSFGSPIYLPVPGLDKSFRIADLEVIANAPGGHRLVVCNERECCPRGLISMQNDPRAHIARQNFTTSINYFMFRMHGESDISSMS